MAIAASVFFEAADDARAVLAPDGRHVAFLRSHEGIQNIWVAAVDRPETALPLTDEQRDITCFQ